MIEGKCYLVVCYFKKDCEICVVKSKVLIIVIVFINYMWKGRKLGELGLNLKQIFIKSILGGYCDIMNVQWNVNIIGGWKVGKFFCIFDIKNMVRCIEVCCDYYGCVVVMFIG